MQTELVAQKSTKGAKKGDFWGGLECMSSGEALMADWRWALGSALPFLTPYLKPTEKQADAFPCPARPACECRHEVQETDFGLVAICMCGPGECEPFRIEPKDVLVYGLDMVAFGDEIRRALGLSEPSGSAYCSLGLREIGVYAAVAAPVFLSLARSEALLHEVQKLLALREGPFLLLTPTGAACDQGLELVLTRGSGAHISLSAVLAVDDAGAFEPKPSLEPMLSAFAGRLARGNGLVRTVQDIGRSLDAIAKGNFELQKENSELRRLQSDGMFKFALRVEPEDFQAFAAVIALGNRKAAAEFLDVPLRSFYDRIERWAGRGADYVRMFRMLEWRKATDRKMVVRLEDSLMSAGTGDGAENPETMAAVLATMKERDGRGYPDILREILGALRAQNAANWLGVRNELIGILREEVPQ